MLLLNINIIIIEKVEVSSEIFSFYFWNFCESICLNENKAVISPSEEVLLHKGPPLHGYGVRLRWNYFVFKIWNSRLFLIYLHYPSISLLHNSEDGHKAVGIHPLSFSVNGKDNENKFE